MKKVVFSRIRPAELHSRIPSAWMRELGSRMEPAYYPEVFQNALGLCVKNLKINKIHIRFFGYILPSNIT
jgi:hypothetical protein